MTREQIKEAIEFLREALSEGEREYYEVQSEAESRGISCGTLYKAKQELGVKKRRQKYIAYLRLPNDARYGEGWHGENTPVPPRYIGVMPSEWITVICEDTGGEFE